MNSRLIAAHIVSRVLNDGQSLTAALDNGVQSSVSQQDRAFIQALCYGVVRHYCRLDFILRQLLHKPLKDPDVRALALVGLYQLGFMRVKPHAAVSETVAAMRRKPGAKGLLNALLRNYLRERRDVEAKADTDRSALELHPAWLLQRIEQDWPQQCGVILQANNQSPPLVLRVNVRHGSRDRYLQRLAECGSSAQPLAVCGTAVVVEKPIAAEQLPGFAQGDVSVQDGAAQLAAELLDVQAGQRVLDICAAPGGKTAHILELQPQLQELVAVDIDAGRLRRVQENLQRLSLRAKLLAADASRPECWWDGRVFERILLDAPCSALGVIRRHPDIKLLRQPEDIAQLAALQRSILDAAWRLLAPGGLLLYATCSILKQENERQIAAFLARRPDACEVQIQAAWGMEREHGRQILPGDAGMDGFYYARLRKR
ncbi:MAG: 16S rRNA (cytosine(967)-C(5))-methyltransferase RsmB [Gammaproteobacteria bacterium]